MGKIQFAHSWPGSCTRCCVGQETGLTHVYVNLDRESTPRAHVKVQKSWYMHCKDVGKQYKTKYTFQRNDQYLISTVSIINYPSLYKKNYNIKLRCFVFFLNNFTFSRRGIRMNNCIIYIMTVWKFGSKEKNP